MANGMENFWDSLSGNEAASAESMIEELRGAPWSELLLRDVRINGGVVEANKDRLFELRFAHALHAAGVMPYEVPGEGGSTRRVVVDVVVGRRLWKCREGERVR